MTRHLSLKLWLMSMVVWGVTVAQDDHAFSSCHVDNYSSVLIDESYSNYTHYQFLVQAGLCHQSPRYEQAYRLLNVKETDTYGDLFVKFPDERGRPIKNQLNTAPFCVAFTIGNVFGSSVLMQTDYGAPMLTISQTEIEFSIYYSSVRFNVSGINVNRVQRLQICANGTDAIFYVDCDVVEAKFFIVPSSGINYVSILGARNVITSEYTKLFNGAVQQLYTIQCTDSQANLEVLSQLQCQSLPGPRHDNKDDLSECSKPAQTNLTQLFTNMTSKVADVHANSTQLEY